MARMQLHVALVTTLLSCCALTLGATSAAAASRLTVSPLLIDLELKPGQSAERIVTVTAGGTDPLRVRFEHADFGFADADYGVQIIEDSRPETVPFSTREWFTVPKDEYRIAAGKSIEVPVTIRAPTNATPGTHTGAAFFKTVSGAGSDGDTQVLTSARTGPLIFISIAGGTKPKPELTFDLPRIIDGGPIRPRVRVGNKGDSHFRFTGHVLLDARSRRATSGTGKKATLTIPDRYVMPGLRRELRDGEGKNLQLGSDEMGIGRHHVRVSLLTDPGQQLISAERTVWVIPIWLRVVVGLLVLAALGAAGWWGWHRWRAYQQLLEQFVEHDDDDDESSTTPPGHVPVAAAPAAPTHAGDQVDEPDEVLFDDLDDLDDDENEHEPRS